MTSPDLAALVQSLNDQALETIARDGTHAAMFFLVLEDGSVEPRLFEERMERPVGQARGRELAQAVHGRQASAVALVSEAWAAPDAEVPEGAGAGDAEQREDVLIVAVLDRSGETSALQTPLRRSASGQIEPGSSRHASGFDVRVFDEVRAVWGLPRHLAFGVYAVVPSDWVIGTDERLIEMQPPSRKGAAHISIFTRRESPPMPGEARNLLERLPMWASAVDRDGPHERPEGDGFAATASGRDPDEHVHWEAGVKVTPKHALVFTYNDDGSSASARDQARRIFESAELPSRPSQPPPERRRWRVGRSR